MLVDITLAKAMASAIAEQSQLPVFDRELDLPQAYRLQHEVSRFRHQGWRYQPQITGIFSDRSRPDWEPLC